MYCKQSNRNLVQRDVALGHAEGLEPGPAFAGGAGARERRDESNFHCQKE